MITYYTTKADKRPKMSEVPHKIKESKLWEKIESNSQLLQSVKDIRAISEKISSKISEFLPGFTDHSVRHMDRLWEITEEVFTPEELERFSIGEAYILACSFYVHDLGMAYCATKEGRNKIEELPEYKAIYKKLINSNMNEEEAKFKALHIETRKIHAEKALELVKDKLPGLDMYLIESSELRQNWSEHIGQVSASHNWSLKEIDQKLGHRNRTPDALEESDLGFLACALRVIDFADINYKRADKLEKLLRSNISQDSLIHWLGQENIAGPRREEERLKYSSINKIDNVDAWWNLYELVSGLNKEIIAVSEYLDSRSCSIKRFSLRGVKGIESPEDFAIHVQTKDFEPIDIRFRADSIERLISLLGGKQLYGEDYSAPIRELIQNAVDAIHLYRIQNDASNHGEISVEIEKGIHNNYLIVRDDGIGMSRNAVTKYLLSIASDYWNSDDFTQDYPEATIRKFKPVGKYGIGFLSVFMISDDVEVETEKTGSPRLNLYIKGLGQRGYLKAQASKGISGTFVKGKISNDMVKKYKNLPAIIKARAPMLDIPIKAKYGDIKEEEVLPKWWQYISQEKLTRFLAPVRKKRIRRYFYGDELVLSKISELKKWPGKQPEIVSDTFRIVALPDKSHVLVCSKGLAISRITMDGMVGLVDIGEVKLDTSRYSTIEWDEKTFRNEILEKLSPKIIAALDNMTKEINIPERFEFLAKVGQAYGHEILTKTKLRWVNVIEPPGNIILISAEELRKIVAGVKEICIVYGASPWTSFSICRKRFGEVVDNAVLITISTKGQPEPGSYRDEDEIIGCPLPEHFLDEYRDSFGNAVMIKAILEIISKCWKASLKDLMNDEWNRKDQILCGFITKK